MATSRPTKERPAGLRPHDLTGRFMALGLVEPANLPGAFHNLTWAYNSERWPVLTSATVRY